MDEQAKPIVRQVAKVLAQFLVKQGQHLDSKIEFREKHQETLSMELDEAKAKEIVESMINCYDKIYTSH